MATTKRQVNLNLLLTHYDYTIDFDKPERLVVLETDILLSARGLIDTLNYLYIVRRAPMDADWKIYYVRNKNDGYLPSPFTKNSKSVKKIIDKVKTLIE